MKTVGDLDWRGAVSVPQRGVPEHVCCKRGQKAKGKGSRPLHHSLHSIGCYFKTVLKLDVGDSFTYLINSLKIIEMYILNLQIL